MGRWARKPVNHTSWVALVTPTDRPKSVRNPCLIELFVALFVLSLCPFDISVGVGVFVIGLSQISSFFTKLKFQLILTRKMLMLSKRYESTEVDRRTVGIILQRLDLSSLTDERSIVYSSGFHEIFLIYYFYHLRCLCIRFLWHLRFGWLLIFCLTVQNRDGVYDWYILFKIK